MRTVCGALLLALGCGTGTSGSGGRPPVPARARAYLVSGRVIDTQQHVPVWAAIITAAPGSETRTDTTGSFALRITAGPGCYAFRVRQIGYGATVCTIALGADSLVSVGEVPLRPSPIPEWPLLLVLACTLPESAQVRAEWGIDTVRVSDGRPTVPALPNLPPDTVLTVARPGVPRSDVLYYRTIVGVIFDDTTSGATIRSVLTRYGGTIIGGVPGDDEYIVRIDDPGETLAALDSVVSRLDDERGVKLARKVYRRWSPILDAPDEGAPPPDTEPLDKS